MKVQVPVLFLIFNRPETTRQVFQQIRKARPLKLYIAADGPREDRPGEKEKCEEVRKIAATVDWDCEVKTLFRKDNLGCKYAVSGAIDWFFENEEMGIILEDDCLPNNSFFQFCEELLKKYADEEKVMTISGNNFQPKSRTTNSYYFSKYMHCWGWASWRRAWKSFDLEMKEWPHLEEQNFLSKLLKSKKAEQYWRKIFNRAYTGEIDSWAYIWQYSIWKEGGLNILPEINLVSNIGFGDNSTHTSNMKSQKANIATSNLCFPLKHPHLIKVNTLADKYTQEHHFQATLYKRVIKKLKLLKN